MCKKMSFLFIVVTLLVNSVLAQPLPENPGFELPGITSTYNNYSAWAIYCWDGEGTTVWWDNNNTITQGIDIPGWNSDTPAQNSGVISSEWAGSTEGSWIGFMMPDPPAWNLLYYKIKICDQFILSVDAVDALKYIASKNGTTPSVTQPAELQMSLYYEFGGRRIKVATQVVTLTAKWATYTLTFNANDVPDSIGYRLGIELQNVSKVDIPIGLDNVRFESPSQCPSSPTECPPCPCLLTIEWVNEYTDVDANGITPDDQDWINLLRDQKYNVNVRADSANQYYWGTLDGTKIGYLNAADLVIVSRLTNRENYDDGSEPNQWNAVITPMIIINPAVTMNNCWRILNNAAQVNLRAPRMQVLNPSHPIFTGVTIDSSSQVQIIDPAIGYRTGSTGLNGCTTFLGTTTAGSGTLIATVTGVNQYVWMAEWQQVTTPYYTGGTQKPGGHRMTFFGGTKNNTSPGIGIPFIGQGAYNLNTAGQKIFLNMVKYMLGEPI